MIKNHLLRVSRQKNLIRLHRMTTFAIRAELQEFVDNILAWDFFNDVIDDHADTELARQRIAYGNAETRCVPTRFKSYEEYKEIFLPIFLEESKAQIHRSKFSERCRSEKVRHQRFTNVGEKEEYLRLSVLRESALGDIAYNRGDLVLLSQEEDPLSESRTHALAYVDSERAEELAVLLKLDLEGKSQDEAYRSRSREVAKMISSASGWWITKICSISTASREFAALDSLRKVSPRLLEFILNKENTEGSTSESMLPFFRVPEMLWKCIEGNFNQFQVEAIRQSRKKAGVSLCLGPPGTGKTTTILGMLSVLLGHSKEEDEGTVEFSRSGKNKKMMYSRSYGGQYEAARMQRILRGEEVSDDEEENDDMRNYEAQYCGKINEKDWMDEIPTNPLSGLLLAHTEYSLRESRRSVRVIKMGSPDDSASGSSRDKSRNRILVCAPSNAAIDEIVRRIVSEGLYSGDGGEKFVPSIVRVGPNVHPSLAQYSLERLAQAVQVGSGSNNVPPGRQQDLKAKAAVLRDAQIVCSTLSVAGSADLRLIGDEKFETVVIDEASQAIELSTLIPLQMGCVRLILVGDHKQLPATVFSKVAESHLYNRSLFERLHQSGYPMSVLKRQMRMHPDIAKFPSQLFYDGEIEDAPNILELVTKQEWSEEFPLFFGPLVFFDIEEGKESVSLQSKVNEEEACFVEILISTLIKRFPNDSANRIVKRTAVVTPYSEQVRLISDKLRKLFGVTDLTKPCPIEVNTVDGFQGREKDIIIASTVRASEGSIGFLADIRRMNVMLTRARTNMWIIGHRSTLTKDPSSPWAQLVHHIDQQKKVVKVTHPIQSFFPRILPEPRSAEVEDLAME